jgi:hypothetical protein
MKDKIPDRRAMEKMSSDLGRLPAGQDFKTKADLQKLLDGMFKGTNAPSSSRRQPSPGDRPLFKSGLKSGPLTKKR